MVAYQGNVTFEHAGSGGLGRMLKKAVTGEGTTLMKMAGDGEVFLADTAQDIHLIYLEGDSITVNGPNLLAFDADIEWDIKRIQGGASAAMAGGLYNMELRGTGWVAILSDGPPVLLNVASAPTFADAQAAITWSSGVIDVAQDRLQDEEPHRQGLRRDAPDGVRRPGLGARAAVRGPGHRRRGRAASSQQRRLGAACSTGKLTSSGHPRSSRRGRCRRRRRRPRSARSRGTTSAPRAACRRRRGAAARRRLRPRAPVGEQPQRAGQFAAALGELVDEARRALGVGARDDERLLGERLQPRAEQFGAIRRAPRRAR